MLLTAAFPKPFLYPLIFRAWMVKRSIPTLIYSPMNYVPGTVLGIRDSKMKKTRSPQGVQCPMITPPGGTSYPDLQPLTISQSAPLSPCLSHAFVSARKLLQVLGQPCHKEVFDFTSSPPKFITPSLYWLVYFLLQITERPI